MALHRRRRATPATDHRKRESAKMIGWTIVRHAVLASTMDEAAALAADGAPEGTVVVAEHQTAGRGRAGRAWVSTPGEALQCSLVLRPRIAPDRLSALSLIVGVAVAEALDAFGMAPRLKWPNDVWLGGEKVAGILAASRGGPDDPTVVVGIGINVTGDRAALPPGATSVFAATGSAPDRDVLLGAVLNRIDAGYGDFIGSGGQPDLSGWTARAALLGEPVEIQEGPVTHRGVFTGVDRDGALLLQTRDGEVRRIVAGDLARGPRRSGESG